MDRCGFLPRIKRIAGLSPRPVRLVQLPSRHGSLSRKGYSMIQPAQQSISPIILRFPSLSAQRGTIDPHALLTLRGFYTANVLPEIERQQSKNSLKEDRIALGHWERIMGEIDLRNVDREAVQRFRDGLQQSRMSDATINKTWRELKAIFEAAADEELIAKSPSVGRKMRSKLIRKETRTRQRSVVTVEEVTALFRACKHASYPVQHPHLPPAPQLWRVALVLFWTYGIRTSDLLSLRWSDVEFGGGLIRFEAHKTGKLQGLPITQTVEQHLRSIYRANARQVFPGFNSRGCQLKSGKWKPGYYATWRHEIVPGSRITSPVQFKNFRQRVVNDYNARFPSIKLGSWIAGHSVQGVSAINYELPTQEIREALAAAPVPECFREIG